MKRKFFSLGGLLSSDVQRFELTQSITHNCSHTYQTVHKDQCLKSLYWRVTADFHLTLIHSTSSSVRDWALMIRWLMLGSLVSNIWKTGGGNVCWSTWSSCWGWPHTAIALVKWSTPFSNSPCDSSSSPSWISSKKNFWTASASFKSGSLVSPDFSLETFFFLLPVRQSWL